MARYRRATWLSQPPVAGLCTSLRSASGDHPKDIETPRSAATQLPCLRGLLPPSRAFLSSVAKCNISSTHHAQDFNFCSVRRALGVAWNDVFLRLVLLGGSRVLSALACASDHRQGTSTVSTCWENRGTTRPLTAAGEVSTTALWRRYVEWRPTSSCSHAAAARGLCRPPGRCSFGYARGGTHCACTAARGPHTWQQQRTCCVELTFTMMCLRRRHGIMGPRQACRRD